MSIKSGVNNFAYKFLRNTAIYRKLVEFTRFVLFSRNVIHSIKKLNFGHMDAFSRVVINQVKFTGSKALPLLSVIALIIGASTIIQAITFLPKFGQENFMGNLLKLVIIREIGPLITVIIILTRSGSAIASELATQKLHKEIDAIEMMGINPFLLMVLPRVIGGLVATILLIIYFDFIAFIGGFIIANLIADFPFDVFIVSILEALKLSDIFATIVKGSFSGIFIPLVCSFYGFEPRTLFEIPIYVSKAVVTSLFGIFILNGIISILFYL